eukprot:Lithocolla_globosa_v1_NODE_4867_length_1349_cov_51.599691.p1 type:complete len:146 gc:universal NODE_4867_length_1349_cov_51.599691:679-1116(+)
MAPLQDKEIQELLAELTQQENQPILLGADLNCGSNNHCFQRFAAAGFEDVEALLPPTSRKRFSMHVPRAPVIKLTDARRWDQPDILLQHPVNSDYLLFRNLPVSHVTPFHRNLLDFSPSATNGLPNTAWSASDHFPIAYELSFKL